MIDNFFVKLSSFRFHKDPLSSSRLLRAYERTGGRTDRKDCFNSPSTCLRKHVTMVKLVLYHVMKMRTCLSQIRDERQIHARDLYSWERTPVGRILGTILDETRISTPGAGKPDGAFPSSAEFKNEWSYTSNPPHAFMACTKITLTLPCVQHYVSSAF
jgi:hypothetical protein